MRIKCKIFCYESTGGDIILMKKIIINMYCIYLFLFGFSNLLLSDVIWLVVEEEVKGLLTRVQPVGNLVIVVTFWSSFWSETFEEPFSQPLKNGQARLLSSDTPPWPNRPMDA